MPSSLLRPRTALLLLLALASLAGCGEGELDVDAAFENLALPVAALGGRVVRLKDREAALPDEGIRILLDDLHLTGTLGAPDRTITTGIVYVSREGGEPRTELVVAALEDGALTHVASHPLGDRLRIEGIRYDGERIVVHLLDYRPDDPPCCPSLPSQRRFLLDGSALQEVEAADPA